MTTIELRENKIQSAASINAKAVLLADFKAFGGVGELPEIKPR